MATNNIVIPLHGNAAPLLGTYNQAKRLIGKGITIPVNAPPLGRITGDFKEFSKSLDSATARVIAFTATTSLIYGVGNAFTRLTKDAIKIEAVMTRIQSVFGSTATETKRFQKEIFKLANETSTSFFDAAEAAEEFSRQGLDLNKTLGATKAALSIAKLSGTSAKSAIEGLTAVLSTFNEEALDYQNVADKLLSLDAAFATSAGGLTEGLKRVTGVAVEAGLSFDETAAALTALKQVTGRSEAVLGNSLKSIFTSLQTAKVQADLRAVGVEVLDTNGEFRSLIPVIQELSQAFKGLSDSQKAAITQRVAGKYQANAFQGLLTAFDGGQFSKALGVSEGADGSAGKRLEAISKTTEAGLQRLSNNITKLGSTLGDSLGKPFVDRVSEYFNAVIDVGNDIFGSEGGASLGKSLVAGIANVLSGPGIGILGIAFFRLLTKIGGEFGQVIKTVAGVGAVKQRNLQIDQYAAQTLSGISAAENARLSSLTTIAERQAFILSLMRQQLTTQQAMATTGLRGFSAANLNSFTAKSLVKKIPTKARGQIPAALAREQSAINKGIGGASASAKPYLTTIKGRGGNQLAVVNTDEAVVRNFRGTGQDAVLNKNMRAGNYAGGFSFYDSMSGSKDYKNFQQIQKNIKKGVPSTPKIQLPTQVFRDATDKLTSGFAKTFTSSFNKAVTKLEKEAKQQSKQPPKLSTKAREDFITKGQTQIAREQVRAQREGFKQQIFRQSNPIAPIPHPQSHLAGPFPPPQLLSRQQQGSLKNSIKNPKNPATSQGFNRMSRAALIGTNVTGGFTGPGGAGSSTITGPPRRGVLPHISFAGTPQFGKIQTASGGQGAFLKGAAGRVPPVTQVSTALNSILTGQGITSISKHTNLASNAVPPSPLIVKGKLVPPAGVGGASPTHTQLGGKLNNYSGLSAGSQSFLKFQQAQQAAKEQRIAEKAAAQDAKRAKSDQFKGRLLQGSFAASFIGGAAAESLKDSKGRETGASKITQNVSQNIGIAGLLASFNPLLGGLAAVGLGFSSLNKASKILRADYDGLKSASEDTSESIKKNTEAAQAYGQSLEGLAQATDSGSQTAIIAARRALTQSLGAIDDPKLRDKLKGARNQEDIGKILSDQTAIDRKRKDLADFAAKEAEFKQTANLGERTPDFLSDTTVKGAPIIRELAKAATSSVDIAKLSKEAREKLGKGETLTLKDLGNAVDRKAGSLFDSANLGRRKRDEFGNAEYNEKGELASAFDGTLFAEKLSKGILEELELEKVVEQVEKEFKIKSPFQDAIKNAISSAASNAFSKNLSRGSELDRIQSEIKGGSYSQVATAQGDFSANKVRGQLELNQKVQGVGDNILKEAGRLVAKRELNTSQYSAADKAISAFSQDFDFVKFRTSMKEAIGGDISDLVNFATDNVEELKKIHAEAQSTNQAAERQHRQLILQIQKEQRAGLYGGKTDGPITEQLVQVVSGLKASLNPQVRNKFDALGFGKDVHGRDTSLRAPENIAKEISRIAPLRAEQGRAVIQGVLASQSAGLDGIELSPDAPQSLKDLRNSRLNRSRNAVAGAQSDILKGNQQQALLGRFGSYVSSIDKDAKRITGNKVIGKELTKEIQDALITGDYDGAIKKIEQSTSDYSNNLRAPGSRNAQGDPFTKEVDNISALIEFLKEEKENVKQIPLAAAEFSKTLLPDQTLESKTLQSFQDLSGILKVDTLALTKLANIETLLSGASAVAGGLVQGQGTELAKAQNLVEIENVRKLKSSFDPKKDQDAIGALESILREKLLKNIDSNDVQGFQKLIDGFSKAIEAISPKQTVDSNVTASLGVEVSVQGSEIFKSADFQTELSNLVRNKFIDYFTQANGKPPTLTPEVA